MSHFDWESFLDAHGIEYNIRGQPNVSGENISIVCPWCAQDQDEPRYRYLSVSTAGRGYRCWRNPEEHHGSNTFLVAKLLNCSIEQAKEITGATYVEIDPDWIDGVRAFYAGDANTNPPPREPLTLPPEFEPLSNKRAALHHIRYLERRGITLDMLQRARVQLYYATSGPYHGRIIFPVHMNGALVSYTARSIYAGEETRYKTLSDDPERTQGLPPALGPIKNYLMWFDEIRKVTPAMRMSLIAMEGPMDALKTKLLAVGHRVKVTCFTTSSPSEHQVDLLHDVSENFENKIILGDRGTLAIGMRTEARLVSLGWRRKSLPRKIQRRIKGLDELIEMRKDPGEFQLVSELLSILN